MECMRIKQRKQYLKMNPAERSKRLSYAKAYQKTDEYKTLRRERSKDPITAARCFLRKNPDCISSLDDVVASYASGHHVVTGEMGELGAGYKKLCMGHVHGGPIVGLIWGWENISLTEVVLANWPAFLKTAVLHGVDKAANFLRAA